MSETKKRKAEQPPETGMSEPTQKLAPTSVPELTTDEIWKLPVWKKGDGTEEEIIEVEQEPRHHISVVNEHTKIITIKMDPGDTTLAHRHESDTIVVILMHDGIDFINDVMGCAPQKGRMEFGQVGFCPFTSQPCVHKITNLSPTEMFVINVEVLKTKPPLVQPKPLSGTDAECHELVKTQGNCRIYKLSLKPGQSTTVNYRFFYVRLVLRGSLLRTSLASNVSWKEALKMGDTDWKDPCANQTLTNLGSEPYEAYICEYI